ncbi:MAG: flagellar basal body L-ring protein FlgH [Phycisphaeraceae bacterium]|nr:flagellar basal body L-ring protein FlgH [Phycisphaeraceae bacterium]
MKLTPICLYILLIVTADSAWAQSSSLYLQVEPQASPYAAMQRPDAMRQDRLPAAVAAFSITAVDLAEPRFFAVNDLVTIIVRESTVTDFESTLNTEKKSDYKGEISDFPNLDLMKLLQFQLQGSANTNPPKLGITFNKKFEGDGEYSTKNEISSRLAARVIDVKPNGTLVLEARKFIQSDKETLSLVLTGTCRAEDVDADNTVLSTNFYDLNLVKKHEGDLRKATKPGILTRVFDFLFAF